MKTIISREKRPAPDGVDHAKALILERVRARGAGAPECAAAMGVCLSTWYARLRLPSEQWPLGELLRLAAFLGVAPDELYAALRYERMCRA